MCKLQLLLRAKTERDGTARSNLDVPVKKLGSSNQPIRSHADRLNIFRTFDTVESDTPIPETARGKTEYTADKRMGEKLHSALAGGGKSYLSLVQWADNADGTSHKCSWEPESNLTHCAQFSYSESGMSWVYLNRSRY